MHTFKGSGYIIHYNSDMSGNIIIQAQGKAVSIPGDEILDFVAEHIRNIQISKLEQLTTNEILKSKGDGYNENCDGCLFKIEKR